MASRVAYAGVARTQGGAPRLGGKLTLARDPYRRMIALVLIMTVSRIHQHFQFLTPLRPALVITFLAAAYAYMNPKYLLSGSLVRTLPAKMIAGMMIAACLSVPFGISMGGSGNFIIFEFSKTIIFAFLVVAAIRNTQDLYTIMWAFVISCGALAYLSLFVFKMQRVSADGMLRIQNGYSYDSNDIATVAAVGLALALLMVQVAKGKGKIVAIVIVAGLGATIAKTGSRGGFLGLIAFGIATLLLLKTVPVAKRVLFLFVTAIALSIAAPPGYWTQMETILSPKQDYNWNSPTGRREVFKRGIGYMMRNPVTGIGIQNFPRAEGTLSERAQLQAANPESYAGIKWSVAHNSFLEVASETGLVGITCYLTLVIGSIIIAGRLRRKMPKSWVRGTEEERFLYYATLYLPIAFITFCVSGFFVSFSYHDLIYLMGSVMAGLILCVNQKLHGPVGHPAPGAVVTPLVTPRRTMPPGPSLRFPQPPGGPVA